MDSAKTRARISVTAWIYFALSLATLADAFFAVPGLVPATVGLIVLFLVLEIRRVPRMQKIAGLALIAAGLAGAAASGQWQGVIIDGIARSRTFLLLFFAIAWLQSPVAQSPSLDAVREAINNQPPGRRFIFTAFGAHILGTVLNLAGLSLLSSMVENQKDRRALRRMSMALMQGFSSASCWSPFYIGMVVVLVEIPTLEWHDLAPWGAVLAIAIILSAWVSDRLAIRRDRGAPAPETRRSRGSPGPDIWRAAAILSVLVALVLAAVNALDITIPVALGLIGPPFGLLWSAAINFRRRTAASHMAALARRVTAGLPTFRNETLVFVAANVLGLGIASAIPAAALGASVNALIPWADAKIALLVLTFLVAGTAGLHPVIVVIFISAVLPPEALGLRDWIVGLVFVGSWGMATMLSPFSGTTLFMSRVTGVSAHVIAWRWSPPNVYLAAAVMAAGVIAIRHLTL